MADRKLALTLAFNGTGNLGAMMRRLTGEGGQARQALKALNDTAKAQKTEMAALQKQLQGASGNITALLDKEKALSAQMARTTGQIERRKAAIARQGRADAMGNAATSAGTQNVAVGGGMAAGLFATGKMAAEFQDGMTDIQQKADMSAKATAKMRSDIIMAARAAKQMPESIRAGVDVLSGFGMDAQQATNMMAPIGRAATAYKAEIADLSAASFANFSNLKVPVNETAGALNVMALAGKRGAFEMRDMAMYFPALTAQAQAFGQTGLGAVADLSAALQIARKATGDSATAANNVQNLLSKINMKDTIKNFDDFGVNLPKALEKAYAEGKTPLEAIAEITNKTLKGDLSKLPFLFGDMQASAALRPLIQNMEEYRQIREDAANAGQAAPGQGVVDADFALRAQNASVQTRALMSNLNIMAMMVGDKVLPIFARMSESALNLTTRFTEWADKNPGMLDLLVKFVVGLTALNLGLGAARLAFGATIGPIVQLYNGFKLLKDSQMVLSILARAGPVAARAFGILRTASLFLARGLMQAGMMMLANPMILIITAIVAAVAVAAYMIWKHWDTIGPMLGRAWQAVVGFFTGAWAWLQGVFASLGNIIMTGLRLGWQAFLNFTPQGWLLKLVPQMLTVGGQIMQGLIDGIGGKINAVRSMITGIAEKVAGWFKGVLGIKSPSRLFMGFGGHITDGLAIGIDRTMKNPMHSARAMAAGVAGAMAMSPAAMAGEPLPAIKTISQLAPPSAVAGRATVQVGSIVINVQAAPGQSPADIAREVERILRDKTDQLQARARSAYRDEEN